MRWPQQLAAERSFHLSFILSDVSVYAFELPTTSSLSFADHFSNSTDVSASQISDATQAHADLCATSNLSRLKARLIPHTAMKAAPYSGGIPPTSLCRYQLRNGWQTQDPGMFALHLLHLTLDNIQSAYHALSASLK